MMRSVIRPASIVLLAAAVALPVLPAAMRPAMARKAHKPAEAEAEKADDAASAKKGQGAKDAGKDVPKEAGKEAGKPVEVGTFGDWGAYLAKGKGKTCYALAKPQERKSEGRKSESASGARKDAAYVFIADRPGEKVHNEVSIMMGFPIKESGTAQALVGKASFDLVAKGSNAWIKNPEEEARFVEALQHSAKLIVKAPSLKGPLTVDSYSLSGLKQALAQVGKDCR